VTTHTRIRRKAAAAAALGAALIALCPGIAGALGAGTSGADFMDINIGSRPAAMGGAFVAAADDVNSPEWNPAGLALIPRDEASFTHLLYIADISYEGLAAAGPIDRYSGWGLSVNYLWQPPFDSTQNDFGAPTQAAATGYDLAVGASYAMNLGSYETLDFNISNISLGASLKLIDESLSGSSGDALYADLGLLGELYPGVRVGFLIQNFGTTISYGGASDPAPANTKLGLAWAKTINDANRFEVTADLNHPVDASNLDYVRWRENFGLEYWLFNTLALRGGYQVGYDLTGLTAGLGFRWKSLELDYAFVPYGDLGYTNRVSLVYDFGGRVTRPDVAAPSAPRNLRGIAGDHLVSLSWDKAPSRTGAKGVVGYCVYYSRTSGKDFVRINDKPEADKTGLDVRLQNDDDYYFVVTAVNADGRESDYSKQITLRPHAPLKPDAPKGLKASVEGRTVTLTWGTVEGKDVAGYNVYYSKTSGKDYVKLTKAAPLTDPECRLRGLTSGAPYYFVVSSVTRDGLESDRSAEVFARPDEDTVNIPVPEAPLKQPKKPQQAPASDEPI